MAADAVHEPGLDEGGEQRLRHCHKQLEQRHKQTYLQENLLKCCTEAGGIVEDKRLGHHPLQYGIHIISLDHNSP